MFVLSSTGFIKSPLNYIGGKYRLLPQIIPLFPNDIETFVDLFVGGANVAINVKANRIICNDNLSFLILLYNELKKNDIKYTFDYIKSRIKEFQLSDKNEEGYRLLRNEYNNSHQPLDLFVLLAYSFNHQIRFNSRHEFNTPFGKNRSSFNPKMEENLDSFLNKLLYLNIDFECNNFKNFDFSNLGKEDFVYCDPPYLITTGTYNDGKRGFTGWGEADENALIDILDSLDKRKIRFALSNVIEHKGRYNDILITWIRKNSHKVHYLKSNYKNSNYHTKGIDKGSSIEVLITNY